MTATITTATFLLAHHWDHSGGPPVWWPVLGLGFPLLWAVLIGGGLFLVRRRLFAQRPADPAAPARTILAERFAHGEIDEDEYHARLAVLRAEK